MLEDCLGTGLSELPSPCGVGNCVWRFIMDENMVMEFPSPDGVGIVSDYSLLKAPVSN